MARSRWKRRAVIIGAIVLGVLIVSALAICLVPPYLQHRQAMNLLADFRSNPCQQTADPLIKLLGGRSVDQDDGNAIVAAIMKPQAVTKDSYVVGEPIVIVVGLKHDYDIQEDYRFADPGLFTGYSYDVLVPGLTPEDGVLMFSIARHGTYPGLFDEPSEVKADNPGTYRGRLRGVCEWKLPLFEPAPIPTWLNRLQELFRTGKMPQQDLYYRSEFDIPVTIRVVAPSTSGPASKPGPEDPTF